MPIWYYLSTNFSSGSIYECIRFIYGYSCSLTVTVTDISTKPAWNSYAGSYANMLMQYLIPMTVSIVGFSLYNTRYIYFHVNVLNINIGSMHEFQCNRAGVFWTTVINELFHKINVNQIHWLLRDHDGPVQILEVSISTIFVIT